MSGRGSLLAAVRPGRLSSWGIGNRRRMLGLLAAALYLASASGARADAPLTFHVPVLMYHNIQCPTPGRGHSTLFLCPSVLDAQMALLVRKGWHSITTDQLAADIKANICPGRKTFVITIDDGALNGYLNGFPIWEKYGLPATFAMVTGKAGDYLQDPLPTWYNPKKPHFSWAQAREMLAAPVPMGVANHTVFHVAINDAPPDVLDQQVQAAQDAFMAELGFAPAAFVYPYGKFGTTDAAYLAPRFALAFTDPSSTLIAADESTDPLHAPRMRVTGGRKPTTPAQLLRRLRTFAQPC